MDSLLPRDYPVLSNTSLRPILRLHSSGTRLRCRPGELYLGAATSREQMHLLVYWDQNVFEGRLVKEWLEEVKEATQYYLGREEYLARL